MDASTVAALASLAVALVAVIALAAPVYLRLGRLEGKVESGSELVRSNREMADLQFEEARDRTNAQHQEARDRTNAQHQELRKWFTNQYADITRTQQLPTRRNCGSGSPISMLNYVNATTPNMRNCGSGSPISMLNFADGQQLTNIRNSWEWQQLPTCGIQGMGERSIQGVARAKRGQAF